MYQVIKTDNGNKTIVSTHKTMQAAINKAKRLEGASFSQCWGVTYDVLEIS